MDHAEQSYLKSRVFTLIWSMCPYGSTTSRTLVIFATEYLCVVHAAGQRLTAKSAICFERVSTCANLNCGMDVSSFVIMKDEFL